MRRNELKIENSLPIGLKAFYKLDSIGCKSVFYSNAVEVTLRRYSSPMNSASCFCIHSLVVWLFSVALFHKVTKKTQTQEKTEKKNRFKSQQQNTSHCNVAFYTLLLKKNHRDFELRIARSLMQPEFSFV